VNDPTTAVTCIGYLQAVLEQVAARVRPAAVRRFADGQVVVVRRQRTFREQGEAFLEIGRYASTDARVAGAVLEDPRPDRGGCRRQSAGPRGAAGGRRGCGGRARHRARRPISTARCSPNGSSASSRSRLRWQARRSRTL
jgi:hypothetical protein